MSKKTEFHQGGVDFQKINDHLLNAGAVHSASELQGYLCGLLCGGRKLESDAWIDDARIFLDLEMQAAGLDVELGENADDEASDGASNAETSSTTLDEFTRDLLVELHKITSTQLSDDNYSFTPLLPEDATSLARRTEELGAWCQGFLHGVGASGMKGDRALSPEAAEAVRDLAEISQVDADFGENASAETEENEVHFVELVEYVRAAVLTFRGDTMSPNLAAKISTGGASVTSGLKPGSQGGTIH